MDDVVPLLEHHRVGAVDQIARGRRKRRHGTGRACRLVGLAGNRRQHRRCGVLHRDQAVRELELLDVRDGVGAVRTPGALIGDLNGAACQWRHQIAGARPRIDRDIRPDPSVEIVVAGSAGECVVAGSGYERVVAGSAGDRVGSRAAV